MKNETTNEKKEMNAEIVTDKETDSFGRVWGKIGGLTVMLTYAVDSRGSWVDASGNYHFNVH